MIPTEDVMPIMKNIIEASIKCKKEIVKQDKQVRDEALALITKEAKKKVFGEGLSKADL